MKQVIRIIRILLSKTSRQRKFIDALPAIFDDIDAKIPALIGVVTGEEIEGLIGQAIQSTTGAPATTKQIDMIIGLCSPASAAFKAFKG